MLCLCRLCLPSGFTRWRTARCSHREWRSIPPRSNPHSPRLRRTSSSLSSRSMVGTSPSSLPWQAPDPRWRDPSPLPTPSLVLASMAPSGMDSSGPPVTALRRSPSWCGTLLLTPRASPDRWAVRLERVASALGSSPPLSPCLLATGLCVPITTVYHGARSWALSVAPDS